VAASVPARRLEFRIGKLTLPDFFDANSVGSDSHLQFMNWTVDNNGAWDYAADTRGYTLGGMAEYDDRVWSVRYGLFAMPVIANGIDMDWASAAPADTTANSNSAQASSPAQGHDPPALLRQSRPHGRLS